MEYLAEVLKKLNKYMAGNDLWDHGWMNHPDKPEISPAGFVDQVLIEQEDKGFPIHTPLNWQKLCDIVRWAAQLECKCSESAPPCGTCEAQIILAKLEGE